MRELISPSDRPSEEEEEASLNQSTDEFEFDFMKEMKNKNERISDFSQRFTELNDLFITLEEFSRSLGDGGRNFIGSDVISESPFDCETGELTEVFTNDELCDRVPDSATAKSDGESLDENRSDGERSDGERSDGGRSDDGRSDEGRISNVKPVVKQSEESCVDEKDVHRDGQVEEVNETNEGEDGVNKGEDWANNGEDVKNKGEDVANKGEDVANKGEDETNKDEDGANFCENSDLTNAEVCRTLKYFDDQLSMGAFEDDTKETSPNIPLGFDILGEKDESIFENKFGSVQKDGLERNPDELLDVGGSGNRAGIGNVRNRIKQFENLTKKKCFSSVTSPVNEHRDEPKKVTPKRLDRNGPRVLDRGNNGIVDTVQKQENSDKVELDLVENWNVRKQRPIGIPPSTGMNGKGYTRRIVEDLEKHIQAANSTTVPVHRTVDVTKSKLVEGCNVIDDSITSFSSSVLYDGSLANDDEDSTSPPTVSCGRSVMPVESNFRDMSLNSQFETPDLIGLTSDDPITGRNMVGRKINPSLDYMKEMGDCDTKVSEYSNEVVHLPQSGQIEVERLSDSISDNILNKMSHTLEIETDRLSENSSSPSSILKYAILKSANDTIEDILSKGN